MASLFLHEGMRIKRQEMQVFHPWHNVFSAVKAVLGLAQIQGVREVERLLMGNAKGTCRRTSGRGDC